MFFCWTTNGLGKVGVAGRIVVFGCWLLVERIDGQKDMKELRSEGKGKVRRGILCLVKWVCFRP